MKKTNFDDLLRRYVTGNVTDQEKAKIEAWLDVKKTDEGADMVLDDADEEKLFQLISKNINTEKIKAFRPSQHHSRQLFTQRWLQVAATVLLLAAASIALWQVAKPKIVQVTAQAAVDKVILDDGTIVWLKKDSRLTYTEAEEGIRQATLMGEGLFEVAKDPSRPFLVSSGEITVKVLGTSFHLKNTNDTVELQVLTGKVNVSAASGRNTTVLLPNEMVRYDGKGFTKTAMTEKEVTKATASTEYNMRFQNTSLEEVVARIEQKFDVEVKMESDAAGRCRITADFTDHSLESTLTMVAELLDIEFTISRNTVSITGNGCN